MNDTRKQAIINALRTFIAQRPGFDPRNYSTMADYRQDSRRATRQKNDALQLLRDIELRDSISADDILKEAQSGRVTLRRSQLAGPGFEEWCVDYCTGQYFPTEFRGAVARLCASVLWTWKREKCMPGAKEEDGYPWPYNGRTTEYLSGGDWLRASFRREYGAAFAQRYFD